MVQLRHPELYPVSPPRGFLDFATDPAFLEELATMRLHRRMSQLPARMMADTLARRIIDMTAPLIFTKLEEANRGISGLEFREARMLLKDAIAFMEHNEQTGGLAPKAKDDETDTSISFEEAKKLLAKASPERRKVIAQVIADQLVSMSTKPEVIEGECEVA